MLLDEDVEPNCLQLDALTSFVCAPDAPGALVCKCAKLPMSELSEHVELGDVDDAIEVDVAEEERGECGCFIKCLASGCCWPAAATAAAAAAATSMRWLAKSWLGMFVSFGLLVAMSCPLCTRLTVSMKR